jgi:hypothetical protein
MPKVNVYKHLSLSLLHKRPMLVTSASGYDTNRRAERIAEINRCTNEGTKKACNHYPCLNKQSTYGFNMKFERLQYLFFTIGLIAL